MYQSLCFTQISFLLLLKEEVVAGMEFKKTDNNIKIFVKEHLNYFPSREGKSQFAS